MSAPPQARERWGLDGFAFGIALGGASSAAQWQRDLRRVAEAEALGLHSIWVPEMHFAPGVTASPLLALAGFGARTRRMRLATTSLLLPIHEPRALADEIAALDRASGGRLIVGLGRGFRRPLFRAFDVDGARKRDRFERALETMRSAWAAATAADRSFPPTTAPGVRAPLQRPHPPLAVAAFGPRGLEQAARHALPYLASPLETDARLADNLRRFRDALPPGHDPRGLVVPVMRTLHVAGSDAEATRVLAALDAQARQLAARPPAAPPAPEAIRRAAAEPITARAVVGRESAVVERLGRLREALGADLVIAAQPRAGLGEREHADALERLATRVWPQLV